MRNSDSRLIADRLKRLFDLSLAAIALGSAAPILAILASAVRLTMGPPIFFRQQRPGRGGKPFTLYKFRTMRLGGSSDAERLTRLGRLLRRTSLDELPQLFNVLKGDMSLVGPRPLLMEYLPLYTAEQARRHEVRPGLTGWAQVKGRNALSWEEKFALDVWYVDNRSFWLDLRILALTVGQVLSGIMTGHGISQPGSATAEPFTGQREAS